MHNFKRIFLLGCLLVTATASLLAQSLSSDTRQRIAAGSAAKIKVRVSRSSSEEPQFTPLARPNLELYEIQSTDEFRRGLAEKLIELLLASRDFIVFDSDENSGEATEQADYIIKARVTSIGLTAGGGNSKLGKVCRLIKCPSRISDALSGAILKGEQITFHVTVSVSASRADTKQFVFADRFTGNVTVRAAELASGEDWKAKLLSSPAADNAARSALTKAVTALAPGLRAETNTR